MKNCSTDAKRLARTRINIDGSFAIGKKPFKCKPDPILPRIYNECIY